ncbi:porin [Terriglobus aquaticus]|uniref:Porin n=1 Tax=Terriglobus aquaticus TaxID=940139 RepID=A0ABW9KQD4_9BACT|nr:porin [Terriglobus aquaticus]
MKSGIRILSIPVLLASSLCLAQTSPAPADAGPTPTAPSASASPGQSGDFWQRLAAYYRQDWNGTAASGPAPARRGLPSPLSSPPFPSADWSYGGSPTIGEPDTNSYPLQTALNGAKGRVKVYGWVEPTVNGSTAGNAQGARNNPVANDFYPNRLELGQFVVYVERLPDSVQRDHIDWGFHLTSLFGTDYRSTTNKGYFSSQLLDNNRQYGFDPALEYVDVYFPHVAEGMNLRVGRFISIPGIEAQLTPNNYVFSHSLLYSVDPFTDTGALATIQANKQTVIQLGISASHDVAPWTSDAKPSFMGCVSRSSKSENNNSYTCVNGINDGKYAFNNIQMFDETWYHKFNSSWHMATEVYFMYERDVPSVNGPITPEKGTNGANCSPGKATCFAQEYAFVNYVNKQLGPHNYLTLRNDLLNDKKGQRTGYAGKVSEWTFAWNHWIGSTIQLRPEIRFDHAWDRRTYNHGTAINQFTAASDLVFHF